MKDSPNRKSRQRGDSDAMPRRAPAEGSGGGRDDEPNSAITPPEAPAAELRRAKGRHVALVQAEMKVAPEGSSSGASQVDDDANGEVQPAAGDGASGAGEPAMSGGASGEGEPGGDDSGEGAEVAASGPGEAPSADAPSVDAESDQGAGPRSVNITLDTEDDVMRQFHAVALSSDDVTQTALGGPRSASTSESRRRNAGTKIDPRPPTVPTLPASRFTSGTVLAERYRIIHLLGRGGMGEVYRAEDLKLHQLVALKFLPASLEQNRTRLNLFLSEVKLARAIAHPNVCRVYDVGEIDGLHFISMEYINGETLSSLLRRIGRVPLDKARELGQQVCQGLAAVHEQGILHRDFKPGNLMIDDYGRAKIMDFGLASLAEDIDDNSIAYGTPAYMAPEQLAGEEVSVQSDIYSLGLVLYQMFAGRSAFDGSATDGDYLAQCAELVPTSLSSVVEDVDPFIENAILRCLELDPGDRPASVMDVALALASRAAPAEGAVLKTIMVCDPIGRAHWAETLGSERAAGLMRAHAETLRSLREQYGGEVLPGSKGLQMIFDRPGYAVRYALAYQRALESLSRAQDELVRARVGLHLGEVAFRRATSDVEANVSLAPQVDSVARDTAVCLAALAEPSQTLLSRGVFDLARQGKLEELAGVHWLAHGSYELDGLVEPLEVFEVGREGESPLSAPPESMAGRRQIVQNTISGWRPAPRLQLPQRPRWVLERKLSEGGFGEVWLAVHDKTRERRVFKFCYDAVSLRALQREITLFRLLKEALGERDDINRIFDWNFERAPYFIESAYTAGGDLTEWAQEQGGLRAIPLETRIEIVAQIAAALAAAHSVGILHKDVKPANVLITTDKSGQVQAKLNDFGIGNVTERHRLNAAGITMLGLTDGGTTKSAATGFGGTPLYMAPEVLEGKPATVRADIYALGVMLFQVVVGDFSRALAPGWERSVRDELVREDVAAAVDGDPDTRVGDALELARRLRRLDERRRVRDDERRARDEARLARESLSKARSRRRLSVVLLLVAALFSASIWYQSRQVAREAAAAQQVSDFLVELFKSFDPENAKGREVSARQLLDQGAARIETELLDQPLIRARLMHIIGEVYGKIGLYDEALSLLQQARTIRVEQQGDNPLEVAESEHALGVVLIDKFEFEAAEQALRTALELRREQHGDLHADVADTLAALSGAISSQRNPRRAEPFAREALAVRRQLYGDHHPKIASSLLQLGTIAMQQDQYAQAENSCRQALEMYRELLGDDAAEVGSSLMMLARILFLTKKNTEAEALFEESLMRSQRLLGEDHPSLAHALSHLGELAERRGDYQLAESRLIRALNLYRASIGEEQIPVAYNLHGLARLAQAEAQHPRAIRLCRQALAIYRKMFSKENRYIAETLNTLGYSLQVEGQFGEAESVYQKAFDWYRRVRGEDDPQTLAVAIELAALSLQKGDLEEAGARVEPLRDRTFEAGEYGWLGAYRDSVAAAYELATGGDEAAELRLRSAYEALKADFGPGKRQTQAALRRLVDLYEARGESQQAAYYRSQLPSQPGSDEPAADELP